MTNFSLLLHLFNLNLIQMRKNYGTKNWEMKSVYKKKYECSIERFCWYTNLRTYLLCPGVVNWSMLPGMSLECQCSHVELLMILMVYLVTYPLVDAPWQECLCSQIGLWMILMAYLTTYPDLQVCLELTRLLGSDLTGI